MIGPEVLHIPNAEDLSGGSALTLCGWVDVNYEEEWWSTEAYKKDGCCECLKILSYCKSLKGYPKP